VNQPETGVANFFDYDAVESPALPFSPVIADRR
jgi:hypothetical protein